VKHHIVNLVISMYQRTPVLGLRLWITKELYHFIKVRNLANLFARVFVSCFGLGVLDCAKGLELPVVEAVGAAVGLQANRGDVYAVEFGNGLDS
jgi:hypothetical protein